MPHLILWNSGQEMKWNDAHTIEWNAPHPITTTGGRVKPLQQLADEITEERLTVFLQVSLFKIIITPTKQTNKLRLHLFQKETIITTIPELSIIQGRSTIKHTLKLILNKKSKLIVTLKGKLGYYQTASKAAQSLKDSEEYQINTAKKMAEQQSYIKQLMKDVNERKQFITDLKEPIINLKEEVNEKEQIIINLKETIDKLKKTTMSADDVLALFATSD